MTLVDKKRCGDNCRWDSNARPFIGWERSWTRTKIRVLKKRKMLPKCQGLKIPLNIFPLQYRLKIHAVVLHRYVDLGFIDCRLSASREADVHRYYKNLIIKRLIHFKTQLFKLCSSRKVLTRIILKSLQVRKVQILKLVFESAKIWLNERGTFFC